MARYALFAFNEDPMCLRHLLLYARDLAERGHTATVVLEGRATATAVAAYTEADHPLHQQYRDALERGLIGGFCLACSKLTGAFDALGEQGLPALDEMLGHPSPGRFRESGFEVWFL